MRLRRRDDNCMRTAAADSADREEKQKQKKNRESGKKSIIHRSNNIPKTLWDVKKMRFTYLSVHSHVKNYRSENKNKYSTVITQESNFRAEKFKVLSLFSLQVNPGLHASVISILCWRWFFHHFYCFYCSLIRIPVKLSVHTRQKSERFT